MQAVRPTPYPTLNSNSIPSNRVSPFPRDLSTASDRDKAQASPASPPITRLEPPSEFLPGDGKPIAFDTACACGSLRSANRAVTQLYDLVLVPTGLKITQFLMLKTIFEAGEIAQCDFAREHAIANETLSRRFSGLRKKGLVELRIGPLRGERLYRLTFLGKKRFEDAVPYWLLAQRRLRQTLGEADWRILSAINGRICKAALAAEHFRTSNLHPASGPRLVTGSAMNTRQA